MTTIPEVDNFDETQIPVEGDTATFRARASYVWNKLVAVISSFNTSVGAMNTVADEIDIKAQAVANQAVDGGYSQIVIDDFLLALDNAKLGVYGTAVNSSKFGGQLPSYYLAANSIAADSERLGDKLPSEYALLNDSASISSTEDQVFHGNIITYADVIVRDSSDNNRFYFRFDYVTGNGQIILLDGAGAEVNRVTLGTDGEMYIKGNYKLFHSGNMGIDSGLDAGLLAGTLLDIAEAPSTVVKRDTSGNVRGYSYKLAIPRQTDMPSGVMIEVGTDGYIRRQSVADFRSNMSYGNGTFWGSENQLASDSVELTLDMSYNEKDSGLSEFGNEIKIAENGRYFLDLCINGTGAISPSVIHARIKVNGVIVSDTPKYSNSSGDVSVRTSLLKSLVKGDLISCVLYVYLSSMNSICGSSSNPDSGTRLNIIRV